LVFAASVFASAAIVRADFDPIPLTPGSFTADVVVEKSAPGPITAYTTATMDGGTNNTSWTWYERGFVSYWPETGLPAAGSAFNALNDGAHEFRMAASYAANNALLVYTNGAPNGSLTLSAPAAYQSLSFLTASSGGGVTIRYTVYHQGGGTESGDLVINDWFNTTAAEVAMQANGRVNAESGALGNLNGTTPNLFYSDIFLTDSANPVTRVEFSSTSTYRAVIFAVSGSTGAGYVPVAVSGFNRDMVVEAAAPETGFLLNATTVTMDGGAANNLGNTFYEVGFNPFAPTTGIPAAGSTFTVGGTNSFKMAPSYTTNNALYVANFGSYAAGNTLTFATPAAYGVLSFLTASGNGPLVMNVSIFHEDGYVQTASLSSPDWFNQADAVWTANGRFNTETLGLNDVSSGNPRLYAPTITLENTTSPVTQITFDYTSGGRGGILAISGQPAAGGNFSPVTVTGYNADLVVEASQTWPPAGLRAYTTASMDGGVNNTGNTWYEQGYYPQYPQSGLPAPGTIITSLDKSDHHYQMPTTYTGPNAAFVDSVRSNVNLTLAVPAAYSALSFLSATANNSVTNQVIIQFQDGSSETNTFVSRDWFNNAPYAFTSAGRVNLNSRSINNAGTTNPRLYEAEFALANNQSAVTNINLRFLGAVNPTTGRMVVLAVSATAGAVRPIIATQPANVLTMEGSNVVMSATIGGGDNPMTYQWYVGANGAYAPVQDSSRISGATSTSLTFSGIGWTNAADYYFVASNSAGSSTSAVASVTVLSGLNDVTVPGDSVEIISGTSPDAESAANAINNSTSKYLNRDGDSATPFDGPVGFTLTPAIGSTVVNVLRFYTANDAEERDPADYVFEGSNDGGANWAVIGSGPLALPAARNAANLALSPLTQGISEIRLTNTAAYTSYRMSFNTTKGSTYMIQIGEIEFLGTIADVSGAPVVRKDLPASVVAYAGRTMTLSTLFGGSAPIGYSWKKDGTLLGNSDRVFGADTAQLVIENAQVGDTGNYQVTANNTLGTAQSTVASVFVEVVPDFNTNGAGWVLNGNVNPPTIADNLLTITDSTGSQARSVYFSEPLYIRGFQASFVYQDVTTGGADGISFIVQNSPLGTAALGGAGGALAISGITPSAALMFNIYNGSGVALGTNGTRAGDFLPTAPVSISGGNPVQVDITYVSGLIEVTLTDTVDQSTFTTNFALDLPAQVNGETAYVGLTGATGGSTATQTIQNFQFVPLPVVSVENENGEVVLSWPASVGGYSVQSRTALSGGPWTSVAGQITQADGKNQMRIAATAATAYYRLVLVIP
jgi:hypothetical protein